MRPLLACVMLMVLFGGTVPAGAQQTADPSPAADRGVDDNPVALTAQSVRLAGEDRIDTAARIATATFPDGADTVYLGRADVLVDALAAGSLNDGPVLLVPRCGAVPDAVTDAIDSIDPDRIVGLGSDAAVCQDLLDAAAAGRTSSRLAGPSRTATAVAIAEASFPNGAAEVYLAAAAEGPDAVAGATLRGGPILLVGPDGPDSTTLAEIGRLDPGRIVVLGGTSAVSERTAELAAQGRPVVRVAGPGRIETAAAIAAFGFSPALADVASAAPTVATRAYLARADAFADAVAGGSVPDGPILLVPQCGALPAVVAGRLAELQPEAVVALGGPAAVCDDLLDQAINAAALPIFDDVEPVIADDVVVLDDDEAGRIVSITNDGLHVTMTAVPDRLAVGDILVAGVADAAPHGVFGRTTAIAGTRITLEAAALTDAIVQGTLIVRQADEDQTADRLFHNDALQFIGDVVSGATEALTDAAEFVEEQVTSRIDVEVAADRSYDLGSTAVTFPVASGTTASATVDADAKLSMFLQIVDADVTSFAVFGEVASAMEAQLSFNSAADYTADHTLAEVELPTIRASIGPVPVVITPTVELTATTQASAAARASYTIAATTSIGRGISYSPAGGWDVIETGDPFSISDTTAGDVEVSATVALAGSFSLEFYNGVAAPGVTATAGLAGRVAPLDCPSVAIDATLRAEGFFEVLPVLPDMPRFAHTFLDRTFPVYAAPDCDVAATADELARELPLQQSYMFSDCQSAPDSPLLPDDAECLTVAAVDLDGTGLTPEELDRLLIWQTPGSHPNYPDITVQAVTTRDGLTPPYTTTGHAPSSHLGTYGIDCLIDLDGPGDADGPGTVEVLLVEGFGANSGGGPVLHYQGGIRPATLDGQPWLTHLGGSVSFGSGWRHVQPGLFREVGYTTIQSDPPTYDWYTTDIAYANGTAAVVGADEGRTDDASPYVWSGCPGGDTIFEPDN